MSVFRPAPRAADDLLASARRSLTEASIAPTPNTSNQISASTKTQPITMPFAI